MGFQIDLEGFKACAWPVASATAEEVARAKSSAQGHREGSALVVSCQRIEAFHFDECACDADDHWTGFEALSRLAEVAAGLHSVVLGEEQILGQVRDGLENASTQVASPGALAIAAARALRSETEFGAHTGHLLDRALQLAELDPTGLRIAILGAGSAARLVAERAQALGFGEVVIVSRRIPEGAWFMNGGYRHHLLESVAALGAIDVLVSCLGSGAPPISASQLPPVAHLAIDLATPRNLSTDLPVPMLTIRDMLEAEQGRRHSTERRNALRDRLRELLDRRLQMSGENSRSAIGRMRLEVERIRREEAERTARLHPDLSPEAIDVITRALVNRMFHRPMERLRAMDDTSLGVALADLFASELPKEGAV